MDENVTCRIKFQLEGVSYFERSDWKQMSDFLIDSSTRMEKAFSEPVKNLNK